MAQLTRNENGRVAHLQSRLISTRSSLIPIPILYCKCVCVDDTYCDVQQQHQHTIECKHAPDKENRQEKRVSFALQLTSNSLLDAN